MHIRHFAFASYLAYTRFFLQFLVQNLNLNLYSTTCYIMIVFLLAIGTMLFGVRVTTPCARSLSLRLHWRRHQAQPRPRIHRISNRQHLPQRLCRILLQHHPCHRPRHRHRTSHGHDVGSRHDHGRARAGTTRSSRAWCSAWRRRSRSAITARPPNSASNHTSGTISQSITKCMPMTF